MRRARREQPASEQLDLVPILNMTTLLIPLLLLGAQFVQLAVVDVTQPAIGDHDGDHDCAGEPLQLTVAIDDAGLGLRADGVPSERLPCPGGACGPGAHDLEGLTARLAQIKDEHPDEESLILVPDGRVPYEVIIEVMDASRALDGRLLFPCVTGAAGAS